MEKILLCDTAGAGSAGRHTLRIEFREDSLHPDILREGISLPAAVEEYALRDFRADALYFKKFCFRFIKRELF